MNKSDRQFEDINSQRGLIKFLSSEIGTLFYCSDADGRILVRRFSTARDASIYGEILSELVVWVQDKPAVSAIVEMLPVRELGADFMMRDHLIYTSTAELRDDESTVELPDAFFENIRLIEIATEGDAIGHEGVLRRILRNSLISPTGKTYFDFSSCRLVIVEPKITRQDLDAWTQ